MIQERYVSFEVAKLLKEKGFDEPCRSYFIDDTGDYRRCTVEITNKNCSFEQLLRPTLYMTMEWLREIHNIDICAFPCYYDYILWGYDCKIYKNKDLFLSLTKTRSYEDAIEAALKYALENLI